MTKKSTGRCRGDFLALVCGNAKVFGQHYYQMRLSFEGHGAKAFALVTPGQFAQIDLSNAALPAEKDIPEKFRDSSARNILLRRPFSFCEVTKTKTNTIINVLYQVAGPATLRMTTLKKGDIVSIIGPLGNGFSIPRGKKFAVLVSGGMGIPPLKHLSEELAQNHRDIDVVLFAGAKTKSEIPFSTKEFKSFGIKKHIVTTDDGSIGIKGFVTVQLENWLKENKERAKETIIYCCGPEAMLEAAAKIAAKYRVDCQVSMERRMACGTGLCQGCAVACKISGSDKTVYKMCCKDGPVFDSKEVVFDER